MPPLEVSGPVFSKKMKCFCVCVFKNGQQLTLTVWLTTNIVSSIVDKAEGKKTLVVSNLNPCKAGYRPRYGTETAVVDALFFAMDGV